MYNIPDPEIDIVIPEIDLRQVVKNEARNLLNATDYKVIKAAELGEELTATFTTWRQILRNIINDKFAGEIPAMPEE